MAAASATTPFAPPLKLSHFLNYNNKTPRLNHQRSTRLIRRAYVSGPAFDAIVSENDPKINGTENIPELLQPVHVISWGLLWKLVSRHKWGVLVSVLTLLGCSTCTLAMPIYSGRFFEVLIGAKLLIKVGILYTLEPIFTNIFVINMNGIWEKVEFFDRYKVGELTALLTSDLGSLKSIVIGTLCLLFALSVRLAPVLGIFMLTVSVLVAVYKRTTVNVIKAHGSAQASIADCVTETFSANRTVREYESSGLTLGVFKSINKSLTQVAFYVSLMALYCLGGSKVKAGELAVGTMVVNTFGDLWATHFQCCKQGEADECGLFVFNMEGPYSNDEIDVVRRRWAECFLEKVCQLKGNKRRSGKYRLSRTMSLQKAQKSVLNREISALVVLHPIFLKSKDHYGRSNAQVIRSDDSPECLVRSVTYVPPIG
ncbi:ABC transporter b family member 28 [Phtheirospermum japonicum]|uniref:ABC transporter b family member 28 n=1 Tax=Phtheirospermum japonicum TaxID=374723 RepID=A0A830CRB6_9LAMI|nr:ABC transporter b family member 28 [Phtheirospermum japonicum]